MMRNSPKELAGKKHGHFALINLQLYDSQVKDKYLCTFNSQCGRTQYILNENPHHIQKQ